MSIAKPFTFVAGQKARANEVNADFDTLYTQVNINISDIAQLDRDIDNVSATKANINGSSTQRFAVANPVSSTDAVNKQTLTKSIGNSLDLISGLTIGKDSNSPNDTILVQPGSAYDSTKSVVLTLANITSKKNLNQAANATYYVYIIGNATGSSVDILISTSSTVPTLPTGYTLYRQIGSYKTDGDKNITTIYNFGIKINGDNYGTSNVIESWQSGTEGYRIWSDGYCEQWGTHLLVTNPTTEGGTPAINLIKTYKNNDYNVLAVPLSTSSNQLESCVSIVIYTKNNSSFTASIGGHGGSHFYITNAYCMWVTKGYLAEGEY